MGRLMQWIERACQLASQGVCLEELPIVDAR